MKWGERNGGCGLLFLLPLLVTVLLWLSDPDNPGSGDGTGLGDRGEEGDDPDNPDY